MSLTSCSGNGVRVVARARPLLPGESADAIHVSTDAVEVFSKSGTNRFLFDDVLGPCSSQQDVYEVAGRDVVEGVLEGYNGTILCYGQTGSGKTHTLEGEFEDSKRTGVLQRAAEHLFAAKATCGDLHVTMSFIEVYMERLYDLIDPDNSKNVSMREMDGRGLCVQNCTEVSVESVTELMEHAKKGTQQRSVAATHLNEQSSRSHSIFCLTVTRPSPDRSGASIIGTLNLVDLAGSERQKASRCEALRAKDLEDLLESERSDLLNRQRQPSPRRKQSKSGSRIISLLDEAAELERQRQSKASRQRLDEARTINKSLSALGNVICALTPRGARGACASLGHIPYRDSKLTQILRQALGGNACTVLVVTFSMASCDVQETLSSLRFGSRAKCMENRPVANIQQPHTSVDGLKTRVIKQEAEIKRLTALLEEKEDCATPLSLPSTQCSSRMSWSPRSAPSSARSSLASRISEQAGVVTADDGVKAPDSCILPHSEVSADRAQQAYYAALCLSLPGSSPSPPRSGEPKITSAEKARVGTLQLSHMGQPNSSQPLLPQSSPQSSPPSISRELGPHNYWQGELGSGEYGVHLRYSSSIPLPTTSNQGSNTRPFSPYRQSSTQSAQRYHSPVRTLSQRSPLLQGPDTSIILSNVRSSSPGPARCYKDMRLVSNFHQMLPSPAQAERSDPCPMGSPRCISPTPINRRSSSPSRFSSASSCVPAQPQSLVVRTPSAPVRQQIPVPLEVVRAAPSQPATPASHLRALPLCRWQQGSMIPDAA